MKYYCPYCQQEEEYKIEKRVVKTYKGVEVNVEEKVPICQECGNELVVYSIENENLNNIYHQYRKIKNIIKPSDIVELRRKYHLSQRELTSILDFGKMTINRYENGRLPNRGQSDYLKLMIQEESEFYHKAKAAFEENRITNKTLSKIENVVYHYSETKHDEKEDLKRYIKTNLKLEPNLFNGFTVLDLDKVENLISYLASKVPLYLTSLNKYLWFIDMISYHERAVSITGLTYMKEKFGPVIYDRKYEEISKLEDKYEREDIEKEDGSVITKIKSKLNYNLKLFDEKEMKIINQAIDKLKTKTVQEISYLSHKEEGWKQTKRFEKISFEYADNLKILQ